MSTRKILIKCYAYFKLNLSPWKLFIASWVALAPNTACPLYHETDCFSIWSLQGTYSFIQQIIIESRSGWDPRTFVHTTIDASVHVIELCCLWKDKKCSLKQWVFLYDCSLSWMLKSWRKNILHNLIWKREYKSLQNRDAILFCELCVKRKETRTKTY